MTTYTAARVHLGDGTPPGTTLHVRGAVVAGEPDGEVVDLGDVDVLPGFVDVHADSLSRFEHPRPGVPVPMGHALRAFAADALLAGVTTALLCCSVEHDTAPARSAEHAEAVLTALATVELPVDVRVHLRIDVTHDDNVEALGRLVAAHRDRVALVSYMDHTPGRGQYPTVASWRRAYRALDRVGNEALDARLAAFRAGEGGADRRRAGIAATARDAGIALAAHDDETVESVRVGAGLGAAISEFPVTETAAAAATDAGLGVVVGAPNLWRGGSHGSGQSARAALAAGRADVVASDYQLGSLLPGLRAAAAAGVAPFGQLVSTVTQNPAAHLGLDDRGMLAPGRRADFVVVRGDQMVGVWRDGRRRLFLD
jgi:alpha-D-ribose 1-methylphosphonate 5-triphosphate diphosphatase